MLHRLDGLGDGRLGRLVDDLHGRRVDLVAGVVGVEDGARRDRWAAEGDAARAGLDLDAALAEEAAEAADDTLALAGDDGVGAEFLADLREQLLERGAAEDAGLGILGHVGFVHAVTIPVVSTRTPGTISL